MIYLDKKILLALSLVATLVLPACRKDFLEVVPKGKLVATNTSDYDQLLNSMTLTLLYPHIESGDEAACVEPYFSGNAAAFQQNAFHWADDIWLASDQQTEWTLLMRWVYQCNKIINEVANSAGGSETQKKSILAEALVSRAWCYFMMINYYGQPYNAATAATDAGVPKILTADVTETKFSRATVKEIYDLIVSDLTLAIPDLPVTLTNRTRSTRAAAEAMLGKTYVFMGQFDKALPQLNAAITHISNSSIPVGLYDFQKELAPGGSFTPVNPYTGPARGNLNIDQEVLFLKRILNLDTYYGSFIVLTPATVALYTTGDYRRQFLTGNPLGEFTKPYPNGMMAVWGSGGATNVGVSVPDVYLLQAECKSRLNDLPGAVADLEAFRRMRMPVAEASIPANIAGDQVALTKFVLDERIREFPLQGYRWFDMRRLSVDPVYKSTVNYTHTLYDMSGAVVKTFTLRSQRLTFRIPLYIAQQNPDLPQIP
ncbi:RagB/SusD family nutrient uptake outer membrane protein [Chitinophaga eiseniae]|uniref:RagB/SusD family nutrient uptake outer membrane protein n=1 Tax=Chitinophaga eiseniae TaxID=634771 RepID=A0A847SW18_9BACT|nr:RagB/SusD family nutrient uptake outer membrane protein [Chitinophaga eiseniae]NLR82466.1 RagB/SusD family nutrient uptake outer membrane protein [Chitinophaga eiseniae]